MVFFFDGDADVRLESLFVMSACGFNLCGSSVAKLIKVYMVSASILHLWGSSRRIFVPVSSVAGSIVLEMDIVFHCGNCGPIYFKRARH